MKNTFVVDRKNGHPTYSFTFLIILAINLCCAQLLFSQTKEDPELSKKRHENQLNGFISKGDFSFKNENYEDAKGNYQKALEMDPTKAYPLKQIQKIDSILLVDKTYNSAIERADYFFKTKNLKDARQFYLNAIKIKGKSQYAEAKVDHIDSVLQIKEDLAYLNDLEDFHFKKKELSTEEQYNQYIKIADEAFNAASYNKAGRYYEWALLVLPEKEYAQKQLDKIYSMIEKENQAKAQMEERERVKQDSIRQAKAKNFYKAIANANLSIKNNQFELAITYYNEASRVWPEKAGDVEQLIGFVKESQTNRAKNIQLYERIIADADREYLNQEFNNAKELYLRGSQLIPDNPYPLKQITLTDSLILHVEKPFQEVIQEAGLLEDQNLFSEAIKKYEEAAKIKPASKLPVSKISELKRRHETIQKTTEKSQQNQNDYLSIIKKADLSFKSGNYRDAALNYELAGNIKPLENYPKEKLAELNAILEKQKTDFKTKLDEQDNKQYEDAIKLADEHFKAARYTEAKVYYKKAVLYKPNEAYPFNQMNTIDDLYAQSIRKDLEKKAEKDTTRQVITEKIKSGLSVAEKEQLTRFQLLLKQADDAFTQKNYSVAKVYYLRALQLKDKDEYSLQQLEKIAQFLKAKKSEVASSQYQDYIQKANEAFRKGDLSVARVLYQNAQNVNPDEKYPQKQLDAIQKIEADLLQQDKDKRYNSIIEQANNAYYDENFPVAKYHYNKALEVKPDDSYAKERIENIQKVIELKQNDKTSKAYLEELRIADDAFYLGDFAKAGFYYQKALTLKPDEEYPKQQIKKISELTK